MPSDKSAAAASRRDDPIGAAAIRRDPAVAAVRHEREIVCVITSASKPNEAIAEDA
jgi:hypothetical protein